MIYFAVIVYLVVIVIYFERYKSNTANDFGLFLLSVFVPIFGLIVAIIYNRDRNRDLKITYEFEDERENLVDTSDSFLLNGNHSNFNSNLLLKNYKAARKEIINFNKLSLNEKSKLYFKALQSDDTEVSHMAAASLMKIKQKFEKELTLSQDVKVEELENYILNLDEYVRNRLVSGNLRDNLIINASELVEKIINFKSVKLDYYMAYVNLLLVVGKNDLALEYANYMKSNWFHNEKVWLCLFNVLLKSKKRQELLKCMEEYKSNNFEMSKEIEEFILFWSDFNEEKK